MSRLRDIGHVWKHVGPWTFAKRVYNQTWEDNLLVWAAALAYSWLFALFPFLIFCLSIIPLLPDRVGPVPIKPPPEQIRAAIDAALVTGERPPPILVDPDLADAPSPDVPGPAGPAGRAATRAATQAATQAAVQATQPVDVKPDQPGQQTAPITNTITDIVDGLLNNPSPSLLTFSIVIALFTASGGMAMTMAGLDSCYDVHPDKARPLYKSRPMAMLLTLVVAVLVLLSVILIPVGDAVLSYLAHHQVFGLELVPFAWLINPLRYAVGLLLLFGVLALVYRWGPSLHTRMHLFSPGGVFCVIMWLLTGWAFRHYLGYFGAAENYAKTYGAVAGVAVLMLLFYLDGFFLLLGAQINAEIDFIKLGIRSGHLPEERQIAPVPPYQLDEEDRELKAEIEERRSIDIAPAVRGEIEGQGAGI